MIAVGVNGDSWDMGDCVQLVPIHEKGYVKLRPLILNKHNMSGQSASPTPSLQEFKTV